MSKVSTVKATDKMIRLATVKATDKMIRLATVKATGKKYVVQQLEFSKTPKAHCWGNLVEYKGLSSKHKGSISFDLKDVEIAEVPRTIELLDALFQQTAQERRPFRVVFVAV